VEPEKPAVPVKKPEPGIPDKGRPAPIINPFEPKPKAPPVEKPKPKPNPAPDAAPVTAPNPAADPLHKPISQPLAEPAPAKKTANDTIALPKKDPETNKGKKTDETGTGKREPESGKTPRTRKFPRLRFSVPGINPQTISGLQGNVPSKPYLHYAQDYVNFGESNDADDVRRSIENVARPGGKTRVTKQAEIKQKIIDENVKRTNIVRKVIADKKDSTVILKPKLKHPELDEN
jgi:hypothetical protein